MHKKEVVPMIPSKEMFAGNADAPVELTVFGDYESPETRQLNETMKEVMKTFEGKVKFVFRHFPLTQVHQRATRRQKLPLEQDRKESSGRCMNG